MGPADGLERPCDSTVRPFILVNAQLADVDIVLFVGEFNDPNTTKCTGIMNLFYAVWDYIDEKLFDKRNTSDCAQFSELLGWPTSGAS
jgi:hypothetical protein